VEIKFVN